MNLIVDIGNTCIKIALFEKNNLIEKSYLRDNYLDNIKNILSKNPVENSIVSNVGEINDELISVLNDNTDLVLFKNILKLPFKNTYSSKETLGQDRIALVSALEFVDFVTAFDETDPIQILEEIRPDIHVNGAEYGEECLEAEVVKKYGGKIYIVPLLQGLSTSKIIEKIRSCV